MRPACSVASGVIESTSITSSAPASFTPSSASSKLDRADQRAGAEPEPEHEHEPDGAAGPRPREPDERSDHERRDGQRTQPSAAPTR